MFLFDLLRLTRRGSTTIFWRRSLYAGLLLLVALIFGGIELNLNTPAHFLEALCAGFPVPASRAAAFASHFFFVLLGDHLALVVLLTPAYVAGAIAEDRQRQIVDYYLGTKVLHVGRASKPVREGLGSPSSMKNFRAGVIC